MLNRKEKEVEHIRASATPRMGRTLEEILGEYAQQVTVGQSIEATNLDLAFWSYDRAMALMDHRDTLERVVLALRSAILHVVYHVLACNGVPYRDGVSFSELRRLIPDTDSSLFASGFQIVLGTGDAVSVLDTAQFAEGIQISERDLYTLLFQVRDVLTEVQNRYGVFGTKNVKHMRVE